MRACVQRVTSAHVTVDEQIIGQIGNGLVVLLGVAKDDTVSDVTQLAGKIIELRIFEDEQGKMNRSLPDCGGSMLVISQFTLLADCSKGRRPSFVGAALPEQAERLYEQFIQRVALCGISVAAGRFRAHMQVTLTNDGPVTLILDTRA